MISNVDIPALQSVLAEMDSAVSDTNPWAVKDAAVFLKYCCPECQYQCQQIDQFASHALDTHVQGTYLRGSCPNCKQTADIFQKCKQTTVIFPKTCKQIIGSFH